jgi:hypothetical protein
MYARLANDECHRVLSRKYMLAEILEFCNLVIWQSKIWYFGDATKRISDYKIGKLQRHKILWPTSIHRVF